MAQMFPVQTLWQQRHICRSIQLHIKLGALYAHRHSNATALQCIHCVRVVQHGVVILFVSWLISHRTHPWFAFGDLWLRNFFRIWTCMPVALACRNNVTESVDLSRISPFTLFLGECHLINVLTGRCVNSGAAWRMKLPCVHLYHRHIPLPALKLNSSYCWVSSVPIRPAISSGFLMCCVR